VYHLDQGLGEKLEGTLGFQDLEQNLEESSEQGKMQNTILDSPHSGLALGLVLELL
jgi:hypothetical protein